jgi:hypothetical protein
MHPNVYQKNYIGAGIITEPEREALELHGLSNLLEATATPFEARQYEVEQDEESSSE